MKMDLSHDHSYSKCFRRFRIASLAAIFLNVFFK